MQSVYFAKWSYVAAYPSGLLSNNPIDAQTISVGHGDTTIIEAK
jgi:hypothetical protein